MINKDKSKSPMDCIFLLAFIIGLFNVLSVTLTLSIVKGLVDKGRILKKLFSWVVNVDYLKGRGLRSFTPLRGETMSVNPRNADTERAAHVWCGGTFFALSGEGLRI